MIKADAIFKIHKPTKFFFAGVLLFLLIGVDIVNGANRYSVATGNWNATSTWSATSGGAAGASVPVAGDVVTIEGGHNVTVTANAACTTLNFTTTTATSLTINSGITLNVSGAITIPRSGSGVNTLAVDGGNLNAASVAFTSGGGGVRHLITISTGTVIITGNVTQTGSTGSASITFTGAGFLELGGTFLTAATGTLTQGTGTVEYNAAGAQTVGDFDYNNLTLSGSGAKTTTGVTVNGVLSLEGTATASVAPTYGTDATLQYNTASARTAGAEWISPFAATGGVIIANTGAITLNSAEVFNASVPLTINSGATLNTSASNFQLTFGGDFQNNGGTLTANASPIVIANTMVTQSIDGFTTTGLVSMTKTAGTATFSGNVNGAGLTINGTGGTLNLGAGLTHTFSGAWTRTNGTLNGGSSLLKIGGSVSGAAGTFTAGTGTVEWNAAGVQTLAAVTYNNLTLSGSGAKTTTGVTVNGVLSMEGTATASFAPTYGTAATLQYNTATARTAGAEWISPFAATGGVIIANTGAITLNSAKVFNASVPLTINSGATLNTSASNYQLTFGGDFNNNGGTFTANASPIVIANTMAAQSIDGFTTTGLVSMTKTAGTATFLGNVNGAGLTINGTGGTLNLGAALTHTFSGTWTRTAGTLDGGSSLLKIGGSVSGAAGTFTAGTGTVEWNAAGAQTIAAITYNNLTLSGSGTKTMTGVSAVNGNLTLSGTATATAATAITIGGSVILGSGTGFTVGTFTHNVGGNWTNNGGTFTAGSSTINFNGTAQTIGGSSSTTFNNLTFSNSGTKTLGIATNANGNLSVVSGITVNLGTFTSSANTMTLGGAGVINGSWGNTSSSSTYKNDTYFAATTGIINISSSSCTAPTITLGSNPAVCLGTTTANLTYSATTGTPNKYSIVFNAAALAAGFVNVTDANLGASPIAITVPAAPTGGSGTFNATLTVKNSTTGCVSSNSAITVTVNPATAITSQSTATQTQCIAGTFTAISVTATGVGLTYQWYSNTTSSNSGGTLLTGATSASYTPSAAVAGTLYYYCIVGSSTCSPVTSTVSGAFIVNPATAISSQSTATQTQCINGTFTAISVTATGTGTITYQWYSNTISSNSGGTLLTGATSASYTPSATVAGTLYYYCIVHSNCGTDITSAVSGAFIVTGANNVTAQSAVAGNAAAAISWTNPASCSDGIMIVAKAGSSVSGTPSGDGTAYTASLTYGSGTAFTGGGYVVYKGTASPQTVTSLINGTQYFFKFFTRIGTVWSSGVETNATPADVSQTTDYFRTKATGNWNATATWESSHDGTNWFNATLTPTNAANTITIQNTHVVTVTASVSVDLVTVNTGGQVTVNTGQTLTIANGAGTDMTVDGTLVNSGTITTTGALAFGSGGTYQHAQDGGTIPAATWNAASNCNITGIAASTGFTGGVGQTFGNFTWNCPLQTTNFYLESNITIAGNLTVSGTGTAPADPNTKALRMSNTANGFTMAVTGDVVINNDAAFKMNNSTGSCTMTVGGNFTISGTGYFTIVTGGASSTLSVTGNVSITGGTLAMNENDNVSIGTLNVGGNFTLSGGFINTTTSTWPGAINFIGNTTHNYSNTGGTYTNTVNFSVNSPSILDVGTSIINGSDGTFTLNSGAGIITAHAQGLSTTAATGSIQLTGTKTYNAGANYNYDGASAQVTGNGLTGANNLTINNAAGVTLTSSTAVSGTLNLTSGILTSGANTVTLTNNSTSAVTGGSTTSFVNGALIWQLATGQTYLYPVGKGTTYLPFGITGITGTAPSLRVEAFTGNAGGTATNPLGSLSTTEYWLASVVSGTYTNGSVSLTRQTALAGLNAIGRSATINGAYSSLNGTVSGTSVINSDNTGNSLGYFVMATKRSITISAISGSPFCAGAAVSVAFTITGTFTSGNVFTAQLSDASGSFTTPVNIGSLTQTTAGTISGTIPAGTASGSGYRIRVVSSTPVITGTDNGSNLTVDATPVSPTLSSASPVSGSVICAGYNSGTATFTSGSGGGSDEYQYSINGGTNWSTYTNSAAITTTGGTTSVQVRARRSGGLCIASAYNTYTIWTYGTAPVAPTLGVASPANGSIICAGFNTGTVTGTGGSGGSTGAANEYQYSINGGGTYSAYTSGSAITTTGATTSVIVQSRRTGGSYGCSNTAWSTISTWTVGTTPVAPTLGVASPANGSTICAGFNTGTVTGAAGSGGPTGAADEYQYSINGGSTYSAYTNGSAITTTGATTSVIVQSRRTGGGVCATSAWSTISTWTIGTTPAAPTLSAASPANGSIICAGFNTGTVTGSAGSGGSTGAADEYQYSINGGTSYSTYVNGAAITTTGATTSVIVQSHRTGGSYGCSNSAWSTISTWTVGSAPAAPTLSVASPANGSIICAGFNTGTVTGTGGSGGSTGAANEYQYSINGGGTYSAYTSGSAITTTGATTSVIVQSRRTGGSYGCSNTAWSTISTWTVGSTPVAPTLGVASPASGSTICAGFNTGTVTGAAGSGGPTGAADEYQYSINGGSTYSAYTNGAAITTTGATGSVIVQSRRTGGGVCATSAWSTICTWTVITTPAAPVANAGSGAACTQITANWTASTYATSYFLDVSTVIGFGSYVTGYQNSNVGNFTTFDVVGLTAGTTYYYRVRASNDCGTSVSSGTITYATTTLPAQPSVITGSTTPCQTSSQVYSVTNVSGVTYTWALPAGWTQNGGGTTNSITVTVGSGSGNIQVTPSNTCGNGTARTLAVAPTTVPAQPSVITGSATPCQASSQTYSVTNVTGVTYTWTFPTGWTQTGGGTTNSVTVTVGAGSGFVQVTPSNACGNGTATTLAVAPTTVPAQPSAITGSATPCRPSSQTYSVTNVAGVTYTWTFPTGWTITAGGTTNSVTVTVGTGSGNIVVTPSNSCGNGNTRTLAVTPILLPAQPSTITGSATPCQTTSQIYSVTLVSGVTYNWTFPTGWTQTAGGTTNSVTVTVGAGTGDVQVAPSNGGCYGPARTLAVTPTTVPAQPSTITGNATPCTGSSQTYSVTNVSGVTYTWTFPSGWTITGGQTTSTVTVTVGANTGNVTVTPSNSCGNGTVRTLAVVPAAGIPAQPGAITGSATPCIASSQTYSVTNVSGVTYTWAFPSGWTQTGGGTTNSVTVTVGAGSGNVQVTPSTSCGSGTARTLAVTVALIPSAPTTSGAIICIGSTATLSASGAVAGETYKWYDAATAGNLLKTSANNADNTYVTPVIAVTTNYWVSILGVGGCESLRTQVTATFPSASPDNSNLAGTDSWIGHVYDGLSFTTYYGTYTETEAFNQSFGGATVCFPITSSLGARSIYTETFSVQYRMNSTKRGLYIADLGSDDGSRLTVDGTLLYNNWVDQAYTSRPRILMNLNGASTLLYDYYENGGANQVVFQNLTLVMSNTLTTNISQSIYVGGTWSTISGNVFGTLPTGITLSGTGYQWSYSTTPSGTRTTISGATGATYTPSASVAPFNTPGTYYIYRNAILSSTNNVSPNPYVATNESNAAVLTISSVPAITTSTTSLTGLNYPVGFGPSAEQSFTVSGTNLSANLVVTPTANFEISTGTGGAFVASNPITLLVNSGNVATTTIYVRLKAGLAIGTIAPENIVCSSNGLTPKNVACSGAVTAIPVITATPNLTGFSYPYTGGPSSQQTFTVSGTNLVANVTVTPSASFEISTTSGSGFVSTPITLTQSGGTLSATTIYVRMKSGLGIGGYSENIVSSSTSATPKNVTCDGTVMGSNTILISTSSLAGFIYTLGSGPSAPQSFTVSGTLLTNNILITPATNYEISLSSGGTYQSTALTLTQSGGTVNTTTIYVRLKSGLAVATYPPVNIPVSSTGAITKSVGCSGAVVNTATIMVSKTTLTGFGYMATTGPSSPQSFTVSGASLSANVSVTPPTNYEICLTSGGTYQSGPITLTQTGGVLNPTTIYARLKSGLSAGNYTGVNIALASGATTLNVACVGIVFVSPLITAGGPGTACAGSTVNLTSVGESTILNRFWQGPNSFYSTLQNPVLTNVTTDMTGTYTVTGNVVVGGNLVTNGDFEAGNTSFGSSYALAIPGTSGLWPESTYDVLVDPHSEHPNFISCGDHTTGTGKQMVVNGSPVAGAVIWTQSVPVIPGASYQFTYWVQSVVALAPSQLQLYINGVAVGPVYTADLATCSWKQFTYNATSGSNTSLNLELINQNTIANGNDFALDDIVFQQILPATSSVDLIVNPNVPVSVSLVASPNPTTTGTNVTFTATPVNGGLTPSYQWKVNGTNVANGPSPTYNSSTLSDGDIVTVVLTSSLTCVTGNPATSNTVIMMVSVRVNYWYGFNSIDWGTASNWTASYIPAAGDDVEFATVANYGSAAIRDLHLDINRTIGSLIDATIRSTVIPSNKKLTVNRNLYLGSSAHINASAQYSTIEFAGTLAQTIPAATFTNDEVYDILINNSNNVTLYGTMRLLHEITAPAGRLDATTTMPTVVYAGDPYAKQTIEMNRYLNNSMYNLGIYNVFGVWLATTASIYVPHDCTITRGVLTVPPGATLTVDNYTKFDYRAPFPVYYPLQIDYWSCLVLKSDSVLTGSFVHSDLFSSAIGNGTAKVERYMSHTNNWHLYSSPIKDESVHYFLQYNPEIPDLFNLNPDALVAAGIRDYNTTTNIWNPYFYYPTTSTTVGSIGLGKGFNIRTIYNYNEPGVGVIPGTGRVDATGIPNLNTVNVTLTRTGIAPDWGWNCIGNPFTCALNIRDVANDGFLNATNISQLDPNYIAVYLWDTNNITTSHTTPEYIVINNATTITSVQTAQGFFVKSKTGGGAVTFTKAMQLPNAALPGIRHHQAQRRSNSLQILPKEWILVMMQACI
ncbi:MAG: hypothetical protein NTY07_08655 [Bacteroidia bacterium]|nr:hypothetical protein [Bacteroidia bacterium]